MTTTTHSCCQNRLFELLHASYTLYGWQYGLSKLLQASNAFLLSKRTLHTSTSINLSRFPTHFAVVKTDLQNFYMPPYMLCRSPNGLSELLQTCYTLCGSQNGRSELLQASYMLCRSQNGLYEPLQGLLHAVRKSKWTI